MVVLDLGFGGTGVKEWRLYIEEDGGVKEEGGKPTLKQEENQGIDPAIPGTKCGAKQV